MGGLPGAAFATGLANYAAARPAATMSVFDPALVTGGLFLACLAFRRAFGSRWLVWCALVGLLTQRSGPSARVSLTNETGPKLLARFFTELLNNELADSCRVRDQPKMERTEVDHLESDVPRETGMDRWRCKMHHKTEPSHGTSAFNARGQS